MAFYAGRLILDPAMENPTIVVITDRNDLDDQLFGTSPLPRPAAPGSVQAADRADLREKLRVSAVASSSHDPEVHAARVG